MNKLLFSSLFLSPFFKLIFYLFFLLTETTALHAHPLTVSRARRAESAAAKPRVGLRRRCESADAKPRIRGKKNTTKSACEGLVAPVVGARAVRGAPGRVAARSTSESLRSAGSGVAFGCWTRRAAAVAGRSAAERGSGRPAAGAPAGGRVPRPRGLDVETLAWFI